MRGLLLIADGMGLVGEPRGNAVTRETMPFLFERIARSGAAILEASGEAVGLSADQTGNSEIGHLTIGSGRRLPATLSAIRAAYRDGSWAAHPLWSELRKYDRVHIVGLASDAGVHGHHWALATAAELAGKHAQVHAILDGVDSRKGSAPEILHALAVATASASRNVETSSRTLLGYEDIEAGTALGYEGSAVSNDHSPPPRKNFRHAAILGADELSSTTRFRSSDRVKADASRLSSVMGRKWACDRSGKMALARECVLALESEAPIYREDALREHLARGEGEATFPCHRFAGGRRIERGEPVLLTNHRADRTVQLARAFAEQQHPVYALVELDDVVPQDRVFFPTRPLDRGLAFELATLGVPTLRIAESCKLPHVTRFMNGFSPAISHRAIAIPSIAEAEIREHPEMSLAAVVGAIESNMRDDQVIIANLANLDQVGHLGSLELAIQAARLVDRALQTLHTAAADRGWPILFTSDHGNADAMLDAAGRPLGSHSMNPVPMLALGAARSSIAAAQGTLANVAPTFLALMGATPPSWMDASLCK